LWRLKDEMGHGMEVGRRRGGRKDVYYTVGIMLRKGGKHTFGMDMHNANNTAKIHMAVTTSKH
jgi:hypothetical protein